MKKYSWRAFTIGSMLFMLSTGSVNAVQLETGKWEILSQSSNPMTGQPMNETSVECIEDSHFDPAREMMDEENCSVTNLQESDESVSWQMECGGGGGNMPSFHGEGVFTSHGDSAEGEMTMKMSMGGRTLEMRNKWSGKKVSSKCDGL